MKNLWEVHVREIGKQNNPVPEGTHLWIVFEFHKPKEWVFGHYHVNKSFELEGTKFTCVSELSQHELEIDPVNNGAVEGERD